MRICDFADLPPVDQSMNNDEMSLDEISTTSQTTSLSSFLPPPKLTSSPKSYDLSKLERDVEDGSSHLSSTDVEFQHSNFHSSSDETVLYYPSQTDKEEEEEEEKNVGMRTIVEDCWMNEPTCSTTNDPGHSFDPTLIPGGRANEKRTGIPAVDSDRLMNIKRSVKRKLDQMLGQMESDPWRLRKHDESVRTIKKMRRSRPGGKRGISDCTDEKFGPREQSGLTTFCPKIRASADCQPPAKRLDYGSRPREYTAAEKRNIFAMNFDKILFITFRGLMNRTSTSPDRTSWKHLERGQVESDPGYPRSAISSNVVVMLTIRQYFELIQNKYIPKDEFRTFQPV